MAFFVLGFAQGTIRRLLGIASILFSFFLAANLLEPLGDFLAENWTQFPASTATCIGFGIVFVASRSIFAIVIQSFYKPQPLFQKARFADEIIGGILGLVQAALILGVVLIILDSFFRIRASRWTRRAAVPARLLGRARRVADRRRLPGHAHPGVLPAVFGVPRPGVHRRSLYPSWSA